jgi:lipoprotein-anchoring transpeptidase ErfK/SrfK
VQPVSEITRDPENADDALVADGEPNAVTEVEPLAALGGEVPAASPSPEGNDTRPALADRAQLGIRVRRLRRVRREQLDEVADLLVDAHHGDGNSTGLAGERIKAAAETDGELLALERQLARKNVGGTCDACGLRSGTTRYCLACGSQLPGPNRFEALTAPRAATAVLAIAAAWLLGGVNFGAHDPPVVQHAPLHATRSANPAQRTVVRAGLPVQRPSYERLVASVRGPLIGIYHSPRSPKPFRKLSNPNNDRAPLVFLITSISGRWAHVLLPTRPNGSSGWIRLSRVRLARNSYHLRIDLTHHRLTAWRARKVILRTPVGVGRAVTPTPSGLYYITELLKQPNPYGTYGPYAFGLSAHSNVLHEFAGGDGVLGIHGTDYPAGIGTNVSHGCIRLSNAAIIKLAHVLPPGTPVRIARYGRA